MTDTDAQTQSDDGSSTAGPARNIVLLSDGTGNSAGKNNKTNVWRLYQALDLSDGAQMAFYDDGVGTSGIRFLRLLGGAFGWGFARNVRDLYLQLCRHYRPGDRIYIFGFSRGAFTARTLAGLIVACGIIDPDKSIGGLGLGTDAGLKAGVKLAYRVYRRRYFAPVAWLFRWFRDLFRHDVRRLGGGRGKCAANAFKTQCSYDRDIPISFIGVWDTVDAVGLPIDELSELLDKTVYPHRFPDQTLSPRVAQACHAVAIDDERHTFHPVLWNEVGDDNPERIKQVWFSGMHSNVGGGYPDDDLAYPSLGWMLDEAAGSGLKFKAAAIAAVAQRQNPLGKMYNSRAGLALYYRYKPRHIERLCNSDDVRIKPAKIHHSVIERIRDTRIGYAPGGLPQDFVIVGGSTGAVETPQQRQTRAGLLDRAQDHIFWRRALYFLILITTLGLALVPYFWPPIRGLVTAKWSDPGFMAKLEFVVAWIVDRFDPFLPDVLGYWLDGWTQAAPWFVGLAVLYGVLAWHRRNIAANTQRVTEAAWWHVKWPDRGSRDGIKIGFFEGLAHRLRGSPFMQQLYQFGVTWLLQRFVTVVVFVVIVVAGYRLIVHVPFAARGICAQALAEEKFERSDYNPGAPVMFETKSACVDTGITLTAGVRYKVAIHVLEPWKDFNTEADIDGLDGIWARFHPVFLAAFPLRRDLSMPWFTLMGEIGLDTGDVIPLTREEFVFRPAKSGRLYVYVNDVINAGHWDIPSIGIGPAWDFFYENNSGSATISVTTPP